MTTAQRATRPADQLDTRDALGALLDALESAGVRVYLTPDQALHYRAPHGAITTERRYSLTAHKGAMTRALRMAGAIGDAPRIPSALDACRDTRHRRPLGYSDTLGRWVCASCEPDAYALFVVAVRRAYAERHPASSTPSTPSTPSTDRLDALDVSSGSPRLDVAGSPATERGRGPARAALAAWAEARSWPALAFAFSDANSARYRVPFATVRPGADGWRAFLSHASERDIAGALDAAGVPVPVPVPATDRPRLDALDGQDGNAAPPASGSPASSTPATERPGRNAGRAPDTLAVLDAAGLWIARSGRSADQLASGAEHIALDGLPAATPAARVAELLPIMRREGITQLWVHASWALAAGLPGDPLGQRETRDGIAHPFAAGAWASADQLDAGAWGMHKPGMLRPWMRFYVRGESGSVAVAVPHLDTRAGWHLAGDGPTLLAALVAYRDALGGYVYRSGPGATSSALLRGLHGRTAASLDLTASATPADFPAPARHPGLTPQWGWIRALTPREASMRYVHGYDKNAMFLAACSSLRVGFGRPEHLSAGDPGEGDPLAFDKRRPGYWLARVDYTPDQLDAGDALALLPHPCYPARTPGEREHWYATPTLALAQECGARISVREAYVWTETHEALEPWYQRLRDARASLLAACDTSSAARIALRAVKATYTQGIGWLDASWLREGEGAHDLYRPDWRHMAIASANANLWRNAAKAIRAGDPAPFAVTTDCWYYASDEPDPLAAAPRALRMGDGLGLYKVKASAIPLAELAPIFAQLERGRSVGVVAGAFAHALAGLATGAAGVDSLNSEGEE